MAYRYNALTHLYVRSGGSWVSQNQSKGLWVYSGGFWQVVWKLYRKSAGVWVQLLHTDKYAPTLAPTATIASSAGGGATRKATVTWTESASCPLPPAGNYDLYIFFTNITDPTKNDSAMIAAGRAGGGSQIFLNNTTGDQCYATLSYQEPVTGGFAGPTYTTSTITM